MCFVKLLCFTFHSDYAKHGNSLFYPVFVVNVDTSSKVTTSSIPSKRTSQITRGEEKRRRIDTASPSTSSFNPPLPTVPPPPNPPLPHSGTHSKIPEELVDEKNRPFTEDSSYNSDEDEQFVEVVKSHWRSIQTYFRYNDSRFKE